MQHAGAAALSPQPSLSSLQPHSAQLGAGVRGAGQGGLYSIWRRPQPPAPSACGQHGVRARFSPYFSHPCLAEQGLRVHGELLILGMENIEPTGFVQ